MKRNPLALFMTITLFCVAIAGVLFSIKTFILSAGDQVTWSIPDTIATTTERFEPSEEAKPDGSIVNDDNWLRYQNATYGFSFRYPVGLLLIDDQAKLTTFGDSETELVAIKMDGANNAARGEWTLSVSSYPDNVASCLVIPNDFPGISYSDAATTTINGVPFSSLSFSTKTAGNIGRGKVYKMIRDNTCYVVVLDAHLINDAHHNASQLALAEADRDQVIAKLDPIIWTLRF
ncbi:hypothetical protein ABIF65_008250 [Bradyrhizobium japonicum]